MLVNYEGLWFAPNAVRSVAAAVDEDGDYCACIAFYSGEDEHLIATDEADAKAKAAAIAGIVNAYHCGAGRCRPNCCATPV